ncbi:MAG: DUF881 domain-containing protein [Actinobacteria bacterium]|nr:DUF881 domain-containing protein [Actinomycetota bacterium]MCA1721999.1 DUF881 domain-containing protein [Actinomycetota bacterium]
MSLQQAGEGGRRGRVWSALVPITALLAGLLFATSAATAQGTDLRSGRRSQVTELISAQSDDVARQERQATALRRQVAALQSTAAAGNSRVAAERVRADALAGAAGLEAVTGPGLTVSLDDAPRQDGVDAASKDPDDLVVHQQDVQAVVNALWAGGAEAMTLMGQRVISTSAVRCVGNTVVLHGRVYSPPFVVKAIGDPDAMRDALDAEPGVQFFRTFVEEYGLGYSVRRSRAMSLPAYEGLLELPHVTGPR